MKVIKVGCSAGRLIGTAAALIFSCIFAARLYGGTVTTLDEASVRSAMADGSVVFAADGTMALSSPLVITQHVKFDASGHQVTLSGSNSTRLFFVQPGATLELQDLTLADGLALGTNGGPAMAGGPGQGGAIYSSGGTVTAGSCSFIHNGAQGGQGGVDTIGPVPVGGTGGAASGGAIFAVSGPLDLTNCLFVGNYSLGGTGALAMSTSGGNARGGAICSDGATLRIVNCQFSTNIAFGGPGVKVVVGNYTGGTACGGAIYTTAGSLWCIISKVSNSRAMSGATVSTYGGAVYQDGGSSYLINSWLTTNVATGGAQIQQQGSPYPNPGTAAYGGGVYVAAGTMWLSNCALSGNIVQGGNGGVWVIGGAGSGSGGAVFNAGTMHLANASIYANTAQGGVIDPTVPLSLFHPGNGFGGGLYNSGTLTLDYTTIAENAAIPTLRGDPAASQGGGIYTTNGTTTLHCTLLANNLAGGNNFGAITDSGYNLASDSSCHFTADASRNDTDARLGPFDFYGGSTPALPLMAGSPAIDGADPTQSPPTDQRGRSRPFGLAPDIGAFESSPPYVIRGKVWGVTLHRDVSMTANPGHTTATLGGGYSFDGVDPGAYVVSPTDPDYVFVPAARSLSTGPDQFDVSFKAYHINALSLDDVANDSLHLVYAGSSGQTYRMLSSATLLDWQPVATNTLDAARYFEFFAPVTNAAMRFFRIQQGL